MRTRGLHYTTLALVIIGALNWGLIGFFKFDLIAAILGEATMISRIIYVLIGFAGLYAFSLYSVIDNTDARYEKPYED